MHLQRQIDKLKKMILSLGTLVEENVAGAIRAVQTRDPQLARKIIAGDTEIDIMEIEVEEECLHTLALHQPVAIDLRFVVAVLKINNDLERIADLAVNIAETAEYLADRPRLETLPFDMPGMTRQVQWMLKASLDSLVNLDAALAQQVREADDAVDAIHRQMYILVESGCRESPEQVPQLIRMLVISRYLERIADHAVNVAEDVIYMAQGAITRHARKHRDQSESFRLAGDGPGPGDARAV